MGVVLFILALLIVIMVHEAGHFTAAKLLGFKATKFFVGFGPTLWSVKRGETEYGVKAIPAGGFVKILGMNPYEEVAPEDEARAYGNKPRWQRAIVILAGPATHWPLAFLVLVISVMTLGEFTLNTNVASISGKIEGVESPAAVAGFQEGDRIVAIDGEPAEEWEEVREFIRANPSEEATFTVERDGDTVDLDVTIGQAIVAADGSLVDFAPPDGELDEEGPTGSERIGFLGVSPGQGRERYGFFSAMNRSGGMVVDYTARSFTGLGEFFSSIFTGEFFQEIEDEGRPRGQGIVGAGRSLAEVGEANLWEVFVGEMVGLTIFIGLMNLLPLVPLDGGHLLVILWEKITGKAVDMRKLIPVAAVVLAFFLALSFVFLYYDIVNPVDLGL